MLEHYSSILASGLVPRSARRQFFARMAADARGYRPPGVRRPPSLRALKTALICRDSYRAYAMLAPVNRARVMARRAGRRWLTGGAGAASGPGIPRPGRSTRQHAGHLAENHEQVT
jgi:hypothetical protein